MIYYRKHRFITENKDLLQKTRIYYRKQECNTENKDLLQKTETEKKTKILQNLGITENDNILQKSIF